MLNTADNFAAGSKLPPMARADTMQTLGEIGLWAKMADFEEEKFYTVLCAAMQNPKHTELFASVRCESAVPLAKADQKLRPRDVNVETAKTGAVKKKAMTRPGGLDDFDLGNAPSTTLVETFELDPLVTAELSAKEESSCMSFFHKVSGSESKRWSAAEVESSAQQRLFEAVMARVQEMTRLDGAASAGLLVGTEEHANYSLSTEGTTRARKSAGRYTALMLKRMKPASTTAGALYLVMNARMTGNRFIPELVKGLMQHEAEQRYAKAQSSKQPTWTSDQAVQDTETLLLELQGHDASHVWKTSEINEHLERMITILDTARRSHDVRANARAELGEEWDPPKLIRAAAGEVLDGHIGRDTEPRWNKASLALALRSKSGMARFFATIINGIKSRNAEAEAAKAMEKQRAKDEQAAANREAKAKAKAAQDAEKEREASLAKIAADLEAEAQQEKLRASTLCLETPRLGTAQVLENIATYPWAANRAGAPIWAAAGPDVLKELIRCDVFEWDQQVDLSLADVYAALKVLDSISSEQTVQVEQLLQRRDKGGAAKSTREMTTAWRELLVETLRATYSIAADGTGLLDDVKENVAMKVTEHRRRYIDMATQAAKSVNAVTGDLEIASKPKKKIGKFIEENSELCGYATPMERWESAMVYADVIDRLAAAEQITAAVPGTEMIEWSMALTKESFLKIAVSKSELKRHLGSKSIQRPTVARRAFFETCDAIENASDTELATRAKFPDAAKYTKVITRVIWHRFEAHAASLPVPSPGDEYPKELRDAAASAKILSAALTHVRDAKRVHAATIQGLLQEATVQIKAGVEKAASAHWEDKLERACSLATTEKERRKTITLESVIFIREAVGFALRVGSKGAFQCETATVEFERVWSKQNQKVTAKAAADAAADKLAWEYAMRGKSMFSFPTGLPLAKLLLRIAADKGNGEMDKDDRRIATFTSIVVNILGIHLEVKKKDYPERQNTLISTLLGCSKSPAGTFTMATSAKVAVVTRSEQITKMGMMMADPAPFIKEVTAKWTALQRPASPAKETALSAPTAPIDATTSLAGSKMLISQGLGHTDQHPLLAPLMKKLEGGKSGTITGRLQAMEASNDVNWQAEQLIGDSTGTGRAPLEGLQLILEADHEKSAATGVRLKRTDTPKMRQKTRGDKKKPSVESITGLLLKATGELFNPSLKLLVFSGVDTVIVAEPVVCGKKDKTPLKPEERTRLLVEHKQGVMAGAYLDGPISNTTGWKIHIAGPGGSFELATSNKAGSELHNPGQAEKLIADTWNAVQKRLGFWAGGSPSKQHDVEVWRAESLEGQATDGSKDGTDDGHASMDTGAGSTPRKPASKRSASARAEASKSPEVQTKSTKVRGLVTARAGVADGEWGALHGRTLIAASEATREELKQIVSGDLDSWPTVELEEGGPIDVFCDNAPASAITFVLIALRAQREAEAIISADQHAKRDTPDETKAQAQNMRSLLQGLVKHDFDWTKFANASPVISDHFDSADRRKDIAEAAIQNVIPRLKLEIAGKVPVMSLMADVVERWLEEGHEGSEIHQRRAEAVIMCGWAADFVSHATTAKAIIEEVSTNQPEIQDKCMHEVSEKVRQFNELIWAELPQHFGKKEVEMSAAEVEKLTGAANTMEDDTADGATLRSAGLDPKKRQKRRDHETILLPMAIERRDRLITALDLRMKNAEQLVNDPAYSRAIFESGAVLTASDSAMVIAHGCNAGDGLTIGRMYNGQATGDAAQLRKLVLSALLYLGEQGVQGGRCSNSLRQRRESAVDAVAPADPTALMEVDSLADADPPQAGAVNDAPEGQVPDTYRW